MTDANLDLRSFIRDIPDFPTEGILFRDVTPLLADPRAILTRLCAALGLAFDERMLSWQPGLSATDGVWAQHWYDAVAHSTGFAAARPAPVLTDPALQAIEAQALPIYDRLAAHALKT